MRHYYRSKTQKRKGGNRISRGIAAVLVALMLITGFSFAALATGDDATADNPGETGHSTVEEAPAEEPPAPGETGHSIVEEAPAEEPPAPGEPAPETGSGEQPEEPVEEESPEDEQENPSEDFVLERTPQRMENEPARRSPGREIPLVLTEAGLYSGSLRVDATHTIQQTESLKLVYRWKLDTTGVSAGDYSVLTVENFMQFLPVPSSDFIVQQSETGGLPINIGTLSFNEATGELRLVYNENVASAGAQIEASYEYVGLLNFANVDQENVNSRNIPIESDPAHVIEFRAAKQLFASQPFLGVLETTYNGVHADYNFDTIEMCAIINPEETAYTNGVVDIAAVTQYYTNHYHEHGFDQSSVKIYRVQVADAANPLAGYTLGDEISITGDIKDADGQNKCTVSFADDSVSHRMQVSLGTTRYAYAIFFSTQPTGVTNPQPYYRFDAYYTSNVANAFQDANRFPPLQKSGKLVQGFNTNPPGQAPNGTYIEWTVDINRGKLNEGSNVIFTDTFNKKGTNNLYLDPSSFKLYELQVDFGTSGVPTITPSPTDIWNESTYGLHQNADGKSFQLTFPALNKAYRLVYRTYVDFSGSTTGENTARYGDKQIAASVALPSGSSVLGKKTWAMDLLPGTTTMTADAFVWTVTFKSFGPQNNLVLTDTFLDMPYENRLDLDLDSFIVKDSVNGVWDENDYTVQPLSGQSGYETGFRILFNRALVSDASCEYTIQYRTKLTMNLNEGGQNLDENGNVAAPVFTNQATLTSNNMAEPYVMTAKSQMPELFYTNGNKNTGTIKNGTVEWAVRYNLNTQIEGPIKIVDQMAGKHQFIEESVKIYRAFYSWNGYFNMILLDNPDDPEYGYSISFGEDKQSMEIILNNGDTGYCIAYKTRIVGPWLSGDGWLGNTASCYPAGATQPAVYTAAAGLDYYDSYNRHSLAGAKDELDGERVHWKSTFNPLFTHFLEPLEKMAFEIGMGHLPDADSVKVQYFWAPDINQSVPTTEDLVPGQDYEVVVTARDLATGLARLEVVFLNDFTPSGRLEVSFDTTVQRTTLTTPDSANQILAAAAYPVSNTYNNRQLLASGTANITLTGVGTEGIGRFGKLSILKQDAEDSAIKLENVVFRVEKYNPVTTEYEATGNLTTGADGTTGSPYLVFGSYRLVEISTAPNYALPTEPVYFTIDANALTTPVELTVENHLKDTAYVVRYVDELGALVSESGPLPGKVSKTASALFASQPFHRKADGEPDSRSITLAENSAQNVITFRVVKEFVITFDLQGGQAPTDKPASEYDAQTKLRGETLGTVADPVRDEHLFLGWYTEANNAGTQWVFTTELQDDNAPATLYAAWEQRVYNLTYDGNGHTGGTLPGAAQYPAGQTVEVAAAPVRAVHTFTGWLSSHDGRLYQPGQPLAMPSGGVTLTAQWEIISHTLMYEGGGHTGGTLPGAAQYAVGQAVEAAAAPTRAEHSFTGWKSSYDGSFYQPGQTFTMPPADVTLTAQWQSETIPVTVTEVDYVIHHYQAGTTTPVAPSRYGVGQTGETITARAVALARFTADAAGKTMTLGEGGNTLVFYYTPNTYSVRFFNGEQQLGATQTVEYGEDAAPPAAPTREGQLFNGWDRSYLNITRDTDVYATWFAPGTTGGGEITDTPTAPPETEATGGGLPTVSPTAGAGGETAGPRQGIGGLLQDLADGNIPLANFESGAWGLLNLLAAVAALLSTLLLFAFGFRKRRNTAGYIDSDLENALSDYMRPENKRRNRWTVPRIIASIVGLLPGLLFLLLENLSQPVAWFNQNSLWILGAAILYIVALVFNFVYNKRKKQKPYNPPPKAVKA